MNWRKGIGIGMTGTVLAVLIGIGMNNGGMMNLHGGSMMNAEYFASIEPTSGMETGIGGLAAESGATSCGLNKAWIGKSIDISALNKTENPYRVIPPNAMMSMDHVPMRMNIYTDKNNIVTGMDCG